MKSTFISDVVFASFLFGISTLNIPLQAAVPVLPDKNLNTDSEATKLRANQWADAAFNATHFVENKGQVWNMNGQTAHFVNYVLQRGITSVFLLKEPGIAWQFNRIHYPDTGIKNFLITAFTWVDFISVLSADPGENTILTVCIQDPPFAMSDALLSSPVNDGIWTDPQGDVIPDETFIPGESEDGTYTYTVDVGDGPESATIEITSVFCSGAPANDDCESAQFLNPANNIPFSTFGATTDGLPHFGEENCEIDGESQIENDVWYLYIPNCDGEATVSTIGGTTLDTKIAVYTFTCPPTTNNLIACNEDFGSGYQSSMTWQIESGSVYLIRLGESPGPGSGNGTFNFSQTCEVENVECEAGSLISGSTSICPYGSFTLLSEFSEVPEGHTLVAQFSQSGTTAYFPMTNESLLVDEDLYIELALLGFDLNDEYSIIITPLVIDAIINTPTGFIDDILVCSFGFESVEVDFYFDPASCCPDSPPVISPSSQTICSGAEPSLMTLSNISGNTLQWQRANNADFTDGLLNIGSNHPFLTGEQIGPLTQTTYFRVFASGTGCIPYASNTAIVTLGTPSADAGDDQVVCDNNPEVNLNGDFTNATGGSWSGGEGDYVPDENTLNATYTPAQDEINSGSVILTLTVTGTGACDDVSDVVTIDIHPSPVVYAGKDLTVCANNPVISLEGLFVNADGTQWSGGGGNFDPNENAFDAIYTLSQNEINSGSVTLTLTSTGNGVCQAATDEITIFISPIPFAEAGNDLTVCANDPEVNLNGDVTNATGGIWSGGTGTFDPDNSTLNATYTPSGGEITNGLVTLTLSTTVNGQCQAIEDEMTISITPAPTVNAGANQTICADNDVLLNGSITVAEGGIWSGGNGTFEPESAALDAVYTSTRAEIDSGTLTLTLTSTGNGLCNAETDTLVLTFTPSFSVDTFSYSDSIFCENDTSFYTPNIAGSGTDLGSYECVNCDDFNEESGGFSPNQNDPGEYTIQFTISEQGGCAAFDTTTTFTITPSTSNTTTISECDSYTWDINNQTYSESTTDTLVNGCQVEILDLTIIGPDAVFFEYELLDSLTIVTTNHSPDGTYLWDFGDGNFTVVPNPTHTYADTGFYEVCLTLYSNCSPQIYCDSIFVSPTSIKETDQLLLNVYPNPTSQHITIDVEKRKIGGRLLLHNILGKELLNVQISSSTSVLDISHFPSGIYLLSIQNEPHQSVKIVKH